MIRRFEEISNNAWPALQTLQYDGWLLRFANGVTKRSNSVNMLYPSTIDPDEKITFCEGLYTNQGIAPCFKITSIADPQDIDLRLEKRGYFIHSHISFQILQFSVLNNVSTDEANRKESGMLDGLKNCDPSKPPQPENVHHPETVKVTIEETINVRWLDEFIRMNGFDPSRKSSYINIMEQTLTPKCLVSVMQGDNTLGVGLGVLERNFLGLFDIVVGQPYRNTGLGMRIVANILQWGRNQGAEIAYLQVLTDNIPAIKLYKKFGFSEIYQYHYRLKHH
ncbi:MAG: GNAT family N-acetyltransferase [Bacteroidales bacterium]|jgi:GNAT superfamily N-acetyltransferase|nr:GNAT family N-acetyltransferase [Bacteroidales bacterium]